MNVLARSLAALSLVLLAACSSSESPSGAGGDEAAKAWLATGNGKALAGDADWATR